ncbi:MAG TPA: response regulator [Vicinamibacterales bacterium]|nr:response regulator [Vicinamibacterales bacterium]
MPADPSANCRILIVDDDRALRVAMAGLLGAAGYAVEQAADGPSALEALRARRVDLVLLDVILPGLTGLEVLAQARGLEHFPRVVMMTADDAPETLLRAVRGQAYRYLKKPFPPATIVEVVEDALAAPATATLPIEVISARPDWLEVVAPCSLAVAERIQSFVMQLEADLPEDIRESVGHAFRELLSNAVEWGGKLDPNRKVRISCIRAKRMLLYRIADPGEGFDIERLAHAATNNPPDKPFEHALVREAQGMRPGGLGLAITRSLVDELIYNESRNEVIFVKYL